MGLSPRYFRWTGETWHRLTLRWMDDFFNGTIRVEDKDALLTATIFLQLEDRLPIALSAPKFDRWPLRPDGTMDRDRVMHGATLAMDAILGRTLLTAAEPTVIHAESRFEHRRHKAEAHWEPTHDQLELLARALTKTGVAAGLARRILPPT